LEENDMKKTWTGLTVLALCVILFASTALAENQVRVWLNGHLLQSEVSPRMVENKVMAPLREVAESLGATVKWNGEQNSVEVETPETNSLRQQVRMLESALAAKTPQDAVETWAKAVQTRNGALEYAILSPRLKELKRKSFEAVNWVTGTSSPWLQQYMIHPGKANADGSLTFEVQFDFRSSTDIDKPVRWNDIPSFPVVVQQYDGFWHVSRFPAEWMIQSVTLPDGRTFTEYDGPVHWNHLQLQFQKVSIAANTPQPVEEAVGNHASVPEQMQMDLSMGKATFAVVERTPPAASGPQDTATEYWLIVIRDDPARDDMKRAYCVTGIITGDKQAARTEMLEIAKTWELIED
jgi:hypothetical protein